jgi:hypothetical protein
MNFNIDHNQLPEQLTPSEEKTPEGLSFVKALLKPIKTLYERFSFERKATLYKLTFSLQVIYLEKLLNDQFNNGLPAYTNGAPTGIYIGKPLSNKRAPVLRRKDEMRPKTLALWRKSDPFFNPAIHKKIVLRKKEEFQSNLKFIVYVPFSVFNVTTDTQKVITMKGWIHYYNDIANYSIVNY